MTPKTRPLPLVNHYKQQVQVQLILLNSLKILCMMILTLVSLPEVQAVSQALIGTEMVLKTQLLNRVANIR